MAIKIGDGVDFTIPLMGGERATYSGTVTAIESYPLRKRRWFERAPRRAYYVVRIGAGEYVPVFPDEICRGH